MQANVPNTAALTPEQVDKRDHLHSGGINSTPAHTHHTSMISDEDSGRGDGGRGGFSHVFWIHTHKERERVLNVLNECLWK